jgi:PAS domain S-box-containing protein
MSDPSNRCHQVSCLATGFFIDYLRAHGVDPARLVEGMPVTLEQLTSRTEWIDLPVLYALETRYAEISPHPEDPYRQFGRWMFQAVGRGYFAVFARGLASPRQAYAVLPSVLPRLIMPFLKLDYEPTGPASVRMRFACVAGDVLSEPLIQIFQGQLAAIPTIFGEPEARVTVTREGPGAAVYEVVLARASERPLERLARWLKVSADRVRDRIDYYHEASRQYEETNAVLVARVEELTETRQSLAQANAELRREKAALVRVSEALSASERRYRLLTEASRDAIYTLDAGGHVRYVNATGSRWIHRPASEIVGQPHAAFFPPEVAARQAERLRQVFATGQPVLDQAEAPYPTGTRFIETQLVPLLEEDGSLHEVLGVSRDVTDRVRAEAERRRHETDLQRAQQLESLGVLAGGIAHDFNNLLSTILASGDLLGRRLADDAPARQHLERMMTASLRASDLCRLMLAVAGKEGQPKELVDLGDIVAETASLLQSTLARTVCLDLRLAADLPGVKADPTHLRQIVLNLVNNAAEALGEPGGRVTVTVAARRFADGELGRGLVNTPLPAGEYVTLCVEDRGCGMDEPTQRRIFEPFYTTKFTGRGLGLPAVLGAVRGHGGTLWLDSTPGKGTAFMVALPAEGLPAEKPAPPEAPGPDGTQDGTVLLVEDERGVREVGQEILESAGFKVLTASNGQEALDVFAVHRDDIDCVVLDVTMPLMDGADALRRLRQLDPDLRVLVTSGHHVADVAARLEGQGPMQFLPKPYRPAALILALHSLLEPAAPYP